ncbi:phosphate-binding periplasmic protein [Ameyamaea chiangmaiensis NBRC 103196]|uniref:Phosphate-binding protein PstS n=1 Tax=Ameyamaea chiangmaiensis TaxID=442969 RepID=A0A850PDT3_9PROT|nr:phosphate ABC transporter substrate-binding protein PstS [Ameyamaea chiangmaiensis]MBS4073988.1 phosphate ABC transporter substrate-binding protein PstS [Ameyamaea chiangmaiensis]NVN40849.1 phosphate ABC transporter substrate-binding protein PstS [Ameyamaea chiangmaiensis]GBQ67698.1 phosphate-binding periplasmic protein [Ameyamaea chiangmaiensis NBRC 103196]
MRFMLLAATAALVGVTTSANAATITGAGSSFAAPLYEVWGAAAKSAAGVDVNYQSVGSSAGQNQVLAGTVDFGASDNPMPPAKRSAGHIFQFPTAMGGIVPIVNLPGVGTNQLHLTGEVLAKIFMGEITAWNDPAIATLNPGVKLPEAPIATVHRADGSGTTFVFTSYLSKVYPAWHEQVGASSSVSWPGGAGAKGNDGVAASVRNTVGGIGYVEYAYASNNHLAAVELKNHAGAFVAAGGSSFAAAAKAADWTKSGDLSVDLLDMDGAGAWPILSATYALVPVAASSHDQAKAVRAFFDWSLTNGDQMAQKLDYVVLPDTVKAAVRKAWDAAR